MRKINRCESANCESASTSCAEDPSRTSTLRSDNNFCAAPVGSPVPTASNNRTSPPKRFAVCFASAAPRRTPRSIDAALGTRELPLLTRPTRSTGATCAASVVTDVIRPNARKIVREFCRIAYAEFFFFVARERMKSGTCDRLVCTERTIGAGIISARTRASGENLSRASNVRADCNCSAPSATDYEEANVARL